MVSHTDREDPRIPASDRVPLGWKVGIGAGALLLLLVVSAVASIFVVLDVTDDQSRFAGPEMTYGEAVDAAALSAKGIANDERGFLLGADRSFIAEAEKRVARARSAFGSAGEAAETAEQGAAVARAAAGFERWLAAVHREFSTFESGHRQAAVSASLGTTRALRKAYEGQLAQASELDRAQLATTRHSIAAESTRSLRALTLLFACAVVIGAVIAGWLVRTIAAPVARLTLILSTLAMPTGTD